MGVPPNGDCHNYNKRGSVKCLLCMDLVAVCKHWDVVIARWQQRAEEKASFHAFEVQFFQYAPLSYRVTLQAGSFFRVLDFGVRTQRGRRPKEALFSGFHRMNT